MQQVQRQRFVVSPVPTFFPISFPLTLVQAVDAIEASDRKEGIDEADNGHSTSAEVHRLYGGPLISARVVHFGRAEALQTREASSHINLACKCHKHNDNPQSLAEEDVTNRMRTHNN